MLRVLATDRWHSAWVVTEDTAKRPRVVRVVVRGGRTGLTFSPPLLIDGILATRYWRPPIGGEPLREMAYKLDIAPEGDPQLPQLCRWCGFAWTPGAWVCDDVCDWCTRDGQF